jgi:RNA polymerase-binding transcription factor DksA
LEERVAEDDQAVVVHDESASQQASNLIHEQIRAIEAALDRMRQGKYGECAGCGSAIPSNRLDALPWATHCADCEEGRERKRTHSADLSPAVRLRVA